MGDSINCWIFRTNIADRRFQGVVAGRWYKSVYKIIATSALFGTTWSHRMRGSDSWAGYVIIMLLQRTITGGRHAILAVVLIRACPGKMPNCVTLVACSVFATACHCDMGQAQAELTLGVRTWVFPMMSWLVCIYIHKRYGFEWLGMGMGGVWIGMVRKIRGTWFLDISSLFSNGEPWKVFRLVWLSGHVWAGERGGWERGQADQIACWPCGEPCFRTDWINHLHQSALQRQFVWLSAPQGSARGPWQGCHLVCGGPCGHLFLLDGDASAVLEQVYWWLL